MDRWDQLCSATTLRELEWDPEHQCSLAFLGNGLAGEVGEACNVIKKLERERMGMKGSRSTPDRLAEELSDALIYMFIIAAREGIDLWSSLVNKFNQSSDDLGLNTKLDPNANLHSGENSGN